MSAVAWIAVDWGTSRARAWGLDASGAVLREAPDGPGMGGLEPDDFEPALLEMIAGWDPAPATPVVACGMVGARQGWVEAPYAAVPCAPLSAELARAPTRDPRLDVRIVPGLSQASPADVMRGEETQIAGFLAGQPDFDGVLCLPGTHTKWARISAGEVVSFQTALTGELFAAITGHTVLRHSTAADGDDPEAFARAVDDGLSHPERLATRLFSLRAEGLLHALAPETARARLSGLLIGMELAATRPYWLGQSVALLGAPALCALYAAALEAQGIVAPVANGSETTLAGLAAARALCQD